MDKKEDVHASFTEISDRISTLSYIKGSEKLKGKECKMYLLGGASLFLHDVTEKFKDIDWFIPEQWLKSRDIETVKSSRSLVDILNNHHVHTFIPDYNHNARLESSRCIDGVTYELRSVSPEINFIQKIEMSRDKDISDLETIAKHTTPENIIDALNACAPLNTQDSMANITSQTLSEINCLYYLDCSPKDIITKNRDLINRLKVGDGIKNEIAHSFGINPSQLRNDVKDPWSGSQNRSSNKSSSFDY